jgi:hypothetical protein
MKSVFFSYKSLVFSLMGLLCFLASCAGPQPVLYPNTHLQNVGKEQADQDIAECRSLAEEYVSSGEAEKVAGKTVMGGGIGAASGAVGGAITGSPGTGAAVGAAVGATAGLLRGLIGETQPNRTYMNFVNKCLKERGYEPTGWD